MIRRCDRAPKINILRPNIPQHDQYSAAFVVCRAESVTDRNLTKPDLLNKKIKKEKRFV